MTMTRRRAAERPPAAARATAAAALLLMDRLCPANAFSPAGVSCHHGIPPSQAIFSTAQCDGPRTTTAVRSHFDTNNPLSESDQDDEEEPAGDAEDDRLRRRILAGSAGSIAASVLSILSQESAQAHPGVPSVTTDDDGPATSEDGRVALEISSENLPTRYVSSSSSTNGADGSAPTTTTTPRPICDDPEARRIAVFERAAPSVVYIDTFVERQDQFSPNVMEVPLGSGSGFIWDDKGHIVTNYHVVRNARSAQVAILSKVFADEEKAAMNPRAGGTVLTSGDGGAAVGGSGAAGPIKSSSMEFEKDTSPFTSMRPGRVSSDSSSLGRGSSASLTDFTRKVYKAKVVGVDPGKDIAVLKVDAPVYDLFPLSRGTSQGLRVGQSVMAIGNPFGLDHTLTTGIISGVGREVKSPVGRPISNVIQTDAAINPGNSGGPLLDSAGRFIGINTAIYSPSGASAGIGFSIPADAVTYIVETLIRDGEIVRPVLGISYLESKQARALGITRGVLVLDVPQSSPAFRGGMRGTRRTESGLIEIGDVITGIDGNKVDTESDLFEAMEKYKPGDTVKVKVNRTELEVDSKDVGRSTLKMGEVTLDVTLKASSSALKPAMLVQPRGEAEGGQ